MRKNFGRKVLSLGLSAMLAATMLSGCGNSNASKTSATDTSEKYKDFITVDVFDGQANFQGIQSGWFAKVVKDKFNMELNIIAPNVAGGGDTLYQTRSANGNLGDLIITNANKSRLKDLVQADLVLDMTEYTKNAANLQKYSEAIATTSALAEKDGTWAIPSEVSTQSAMTSTEATDPTNAPSLRWDLYKALGYPAMNTLEDLLPVMQQMQDKAGTSTSGKKVYAFSLFKDWDGDFMQNAGALTSLYGYDAIGFASMKVDGNDIQSVIDSDSAYVRALKFLFKANQMGLVDPESTTQNFDTLANKYTDGSVLYSLWPWLGAGYYNTKDNTAAGKGFASAAIKDIDCLGYGNSPTGLTTNTIMIGSKAKDPQRLADFIDWLYSPEGIEMSATQTGGKCGPEGLTWEMKDEKPVLTDFGKRAFIDIEETLQVPDEWGGGTWKDGISALNFNAVGITESNDATGMCYNYARWDDYINLTQTTLSKDWQSKMDAKTGIEYFNKNKLLAVCPGTGYAIPEYSTDINAIKEQCKQTIIENSWKMVFAKDEDEFNSLLTTMQNTTKGLGYDQVYKIDQKNCKDKYVELEKARTANK